MPAASSFRPRALPWVLPLTVHASCLGGPKFVAISPDYGYVDGCTPVELTGSELGTEAAATVGGLAVLELAPAAYDPAFPEHAQDVGFEYTALTPPKADGEAGWVDVVLTVAGEEKTLPDGFYYVACPGTVHVEEVSATEAAPGDAVTLQGCGLSASGVRGQLLSGVDGSEVADFPLVLVCGTGAARFDVPAVPDGTYWLQLTAADATTWGGACVGGGDTGVADTDTDTDGSDTDGSDTDSGGGAADTGDPCAGLVAITVSAGGAP